MSENAGFLLNFGVSLPSPTSRGAPTLLANAVTRLNFKAQEFFDSVKKILRKLVFDFDNLVRFLRFEIKLSHGNSGPKLAAADFARKLVFRFAHSMAATLTDIAIFPGAVAVSFLFHNRVLKMLGNKVSKRDIAPSSFGYYTVEKGLCRVFADSFGKLSKEPFQVMRPSSRRRLPARFWSSSPPRRTPERQARRRTTPRAREAHSAVRDR